MKTLAELIQEQLVLGRESGTGFHQIRCAVCNDHSERGGFKFDLQTTGYHCFNCNARFKAEEGTGKLSQNARQILAAFGVDLTELTGSTASLIFTEQEVSPVVQRELVTYQPKVKSVQEDRVQDVRNLLQRVVLTQILAEDFNEDLEGIARKILR